MHLTDAARSQPDKPAVVMSGSGRTMTYAADASWTRDRLSVQPADVIAGLTETVEWLRSHGQIG